MRLAVTFHLLLIIVFAPYGFDGAAVPQCEKVAIPLLLDSTRNDLEVTGSWLSIQPEGTLRGDVSIRNETGRSLSGLTVIVNYLDENSTILFSIPYVASLGTEENQLRNIHPLSELRLNRPVEPGHDIRLTAINGFGVNKLPVSAEVTFWLAHHADDGSSESHQIGHRGFRTDPLLVETPGAYVRLSRPHPSEAIETILKLQINQYGRVLGVRPEEQRDSALSHDQIEAIEKQLTNWRFFPAVENGYMIASDLYLILDFLPENPLPMKRCPLEGTESHVQKFAFVALEPIPDSDKWIPYYGGFPAGGKLQPNIITESESEIPDKRLH